MPKQTLKARGLIIVNYYHIKQFGLEESCFALLQPPAGEGEGEGPPKNLTHAHKPNASIIVHTFGTLIHEKKNNAKIKFTKNNCNFIFIFNFLIFI